VSDFEIQGREGGSRMVTGRLNKLLNNLFGCAHRRTTFPISPRRTINNTRQNRAYVACLDCGGEFAYDWQEMRICEPLAPVTVENKPLRI
jgi:hypothetical protein